RARPPSSTRFPYTTLFRSLVEQPHPALDQLALGGDQQHVHLQALRVGVEDLEVELDVRHVERDVLLRLPADHLAGVALLHPVHLDRKSTRLNSSHVSISYA